ncbi:PAS domain-containing protein [Flavobacterium sp. D11R37]|uniref:PAS domain-containing protein n=1 Tax=Flavobacterium coralii TaxID=2838017 RepID=UPI001CA645D8|nr:PAS domain-containing protein [Flavobacterium coralii]MBY8962019.1 PAS domain-containing protein [Flavobacterium coralii]
MSSSHFSDSGITMALEASGIGIWQLSVSSGKMHINAVAATLFGLSGESEVHYTDILRHTHPRDAGEALATWESFIALAHGDIEFKYRLSQQLEGKRLLIRGKFYREGENIIASGTVQQIRNSNFFEPQVGQYDLKAIIAEAPLAVALYVGRELIIGIANDVMLSYWGKDRSVIGTTLEEAVPELEGQPFLQILDNVFTTGTIYQVSEAPAKLALNGVLDVYYFDFTYKPMYDERGEIYAILNTAVNVTDRVIAKRKRQESELKIRAIIEQSPVAIAFLSGKEMIIEVGNDRIFELWGKGSGVTGMALAEALPEVKDQGFIDLLENVYTTGETFYGYDYPAKLMHGGELKDFYFDFTYSALRDEAGNINGVLILAMDVTQRLNNIRKLQESESQIRAIVNSAPAAMAVFRGKDLIIDVTNKAFQDIVGRKEDITGMPLLEAMPEMTGQKSIDLMHHVLKTGEKVHNYARQVDIVKHGVMTHNYYNVSYTPLFDADGNVTAVLDVAIDVTEAMKVRQAIEEAEASLRGAIELAELGTWSFYPESSMVTYSERMLQWFGFDGKTVNLEQVLEVIHAKDRERIAAAVEKALQPGSDRHYDEEYTVVNRLNGRERILHAQGRAYFKEDGKPYLLTGTAQDITAQKKLQLELENQVKERTEELQRANIELEEANLRLVHSNEELAQYAYVASHDLQEPLRKISIFSNLLKDKDTEGRHASVVNKIIKSSERMSLLIKDLLEFSRLLNPDVRFAQVNLTEIVKAVIGDFELLIEEKSAKVSYENLVEIEAVPLQMNQLFYNLISNALKFVPKERQPLISISCKIADPDTIKDHISHAEPGVTYYIFTVKDNGIGISGQYAKQVFEVFKRLHGREEYSGSGIGLAICRRIANNHNGAIFIESEPGVGTSFHILLPEKQKQ